MTPLYPAEKYTYRVLWSEATQRYVGVCTEFNTLTHEAMTADAALAGIIACVRRELEGKPSSEATPTPLSQRLLGKQYR